ncbi:hypothetical protein SLH46_07610 [Draconibacterium sp. IB214405]|uniref:hypothetical protein n=1 Tax=Draconibacterium sp. IB214405 TaxID=3097352 RepID=UPI002A0FE0BD|nr:hypothetical protein [Draconibacterium sp. IB214405]MDX8339045.1 hypothetical protein [Draconibacterium sp. IB214405]
MKVKIMTLKSACILFAALIFVGLGACKTKTSNDKEQLSVEEDIWVVEEYEISDLPLTSESPIAMNTSFEGNVDPVDEEDALLEEEEIDEAIAEEAVELEEEAELEEMYEIATLEYLIDMIEEQEYEAEEIVDVSELVVPLEETQTVVGFNKKGEEKNAFQVISDQETGEIEQVIFTDKKHHDEYDVSVGMTVKEVKKLRRELKHMVHKDKAFLYDENSNVMYLLDSQNLEGDEITEADIENMEVSALIWKDKKHHKR